MAHDSAPTDHLRQTGPNLLKLAKARKFTELDAAWMNNLEQPTVTWAELFEVPEYLVRSNETDQAVLLLWALVASARDKLPPADALPLAKRAALLAPNDGSLKAELAELYLQALPDIPEIRVLLDHCGLKADTLAGLAIERMEHFLRLRPGSYVRDKSSGGVGRVEMVNQLGFAVNFGQSTTVFDPPAAVKLDPLENDDLRALALFTPQAVADLRESDPAEIVRLALKTFGGRMEFRQLKERLTATAIPSSTWGAWWAKAREAVRRSPHIEMTDDAQPYLVLRRTPLSYEDRIRRYFAVASTPSEKFDLALEYLRGTQAGQAPSSAITEQIRTGLEKLAQDFRESQPSLTLAALALLAELKRRVPGLDYTSTITIESVLAKIPEVTQLAADISNEAVFLAILSLIKDTLRDLWADYYARILPGCPSRVCDIMARELIVAQKDRAIAAVIGAITARPESHPEAFIWLWKTACSQKAEGPFAALHPAALTLSLLTLGDWAANVNRGGDREKARALITQLRHTIAANDYRIIRGVVEKCTEEEAHHLNDALNRNRFLSDYARNDIIAILSSTHRHLFVEHKKPWQEDVIYSTPEGLQKRSKELERIANVELPKVAEAIGRAIGFGDISDNAEYRAGLEHRDNLSKKAALIRQEIGKTRLITTDMVKGDEVTVGAKVTTRNLATNEEETFSFLGPWDTDVPNRVYSYLAPFSLAFMGKRKGDIVTAPGAEGPRRYEVLSIALAV